MIKSDRKALRRAALAALILGIVFLFGLVDLGLQAFTGQAAHQNILFPILPLILLLFVMMCGLVWFGFLLFRLRRVNKRRTRALQGDQSLLAASQPVPDQNALFLPTTIQFRLRRRYSMAMLGLISVVVLVLIYSSKGSPFSLTIPVSASSLAIALGTFLIQLFIGTVIIYLTLRIQMEYDLEVNEHGLSVIHGNVRTAVNWSDARLFAVNDTKKPKRPKVYELATRDTVARWMWLPPGRTFFSALKPTLPLEEYNQKMQAVLQLIEAKTHLPLYDIGRPSMLNPLLRGRR